MTHAVSPRLSAVLGLACAAALLAGCTGTTAGGGLAEPITPTQRFSLQVEPGVERIALAVQEQGLSANQQNALVDIANRFGLEGAPVLRIEAPSGDDALARDMAWRVKGEFERIGVPPHQIQVVAYDAPDPRAPVLVGYDTVRMQVPRCGQHWGSFTRTGANETSANFGCAVTANLAAQIANPRDVLGPQPMTPSDAGRRALVFDNYRKGVLTAAPQEELVGNRRVSEAVE